MIKILITLDTRLVDEQDICPCEIYNSYEASSWHELDVQRKILQIVVGYSHPWCILTFGHFRRFQDANAVAVK